MPTDPRELRRLLTEIRGAVDGQPREALVEILTYLLKEYVVDGNGPIGASAHQLIDAQSTLQGLPFAELITWLQLHVDTPELSLFDVQGGRVTVRINGRPVGVELRAQPEPLPERPAAAPAPAAAEPAPDVANAVRNATTAAAPIARPAAPAAAPRPGAQAPARPAAAPTAAAPAGAPAAPGAPAQSTTEGTSTEGGDSQDRFSWLEVD